MKLKVFIFSGLALLLMLCATPVSANGIPGLPHAFYGTVTINDDPAPDGTQISATVAEGEVLTTSQNPIATVNGNYGIDGLHLLVQGDGLSGAITFYVNGVEVEGVTATFEAGGGPTEMNLDLVSDVIAREVKTVPAGTSSVTLSEAGTPVATVIVTTTGPVTITVEEYASNPGTQSFSGDTGKYIDVHIDNPANVTELEIRLYYTDAEITALGLDEASLKLRWWDGDSWDVITPATATGVNMGANYIWAIINNTTRPSLADLTGTAFGAGGTAAAVGGGGGGVAMVTLSLTGLVATPPLLVDAGGLAQSTCQLTTTDGKLTLYIAAGTRFLDSLGNPLAFITAAPEPSPPAPPSDEAIVTAYRLGPDGAAFSPQITLTINYDPTTLPEGVAEQDLYIAYWDGSNWLALTTTVDAEANTASCELSHFTTFAVIAPAAPPLPAPAAFAVSDLSITPAEVEPNEAVTISVSVANTGGTEGSYNVVLMINDATEAEESVTIAAGDSQSVSFSVTKEDAGSYSVAVDGLSDSFTVVTPPPVKPPINWPLIGGIIAAVVVVGLLIFFLVRRRA